jgi:hypothetical protein
MRARRSVQLLAVFTSLATFAACNSYGRGRDPNGAIVTVQWDSGPLDRAYHSERSAMDTRHQDETAHPRADESSDQRGQRQTNEDKDLERRYAQGKASHSDRLPSGDR